MSHDGTTDDCSTPGADDDRSTPGADAPMTGFADADRPPARLVDTDPGSGAVTTHDILGGGQIEIAPAAVDRLLGVGPADVVAAGALTFARNVFVPLTTACRYTCTYCTYFDPPGEASLLSPDEVRDIVRTGADA
ncbi:MAG: hypothetical protein ACI9K3_001353, partial [Halovenus sp.]